MPDATSPARPAASFEVAVLGAGVAGLAAARVLSAAGQHVVVLEAQERVGGRIHTLEIGGEFVELGAEFLHGRAPELWALLEEAGLATYELTGDFMRPGDPGPAVMEEEGDDLLESLEHFPGPDCSFAEYLDRQNLPPDQAAREIGFVEGFNAADASQASVLALGRQQQAEDEIGGDRSWRICSGYASLPAFLRRQFEAAGGELRLNTPVCAVDREAQPAIPGAQIHCADGTTLHARKVVVTLPLGVLQSGSVRFTPPPADVLAAAGRMRMGHALRGTFIFRRRLWPEHMSFLLGGNTAPGVWWTAHPAESLTLTGWVGGPRTRQLESLDRAALQDRFVTELAKALNLPPSAVPAEVEHFHTHDWTADPWSRGAYSWVPVGGIDASEQMSQPVDGTLFFAGEHTDTTGHWGTVHAALRSGLRAARQVLAS